MKNFTIFRISLVSTVLLFLAALITPIATIAVDLLSSNSGKVLEYICVWCQYGSVDNNPNGTANMIFITPFDFYFIWIPIALLLLMSLIPLAKAFPKLGYSDKFSDTLVITMLWIMGGLALAIRASLTFLIKLKVDKYQELFPNNQVIGELSWASGALVIGAIMAGSTAMFGYMEFLYDIDQAKNDDLNAISKN